MKMVGSPLIRRPLFTLRRHCCKEPALPAVISFLGRDEACEKSVLAADVFLSEGEMVRLAAPISRSLILDLKLKKQISEWKR